MWLLLCFYGKIYSLIWYEDSINYNCEVNIELIFLYNPDVFGGLFLIFFDHTHWCSELTPGTISRDQPWRAWNSNCGIWVFCMKSKFHIQCTITLALDEQTSARRRLCDTRDRCFGEWKKYARCLYHPHYCSGCARSLMVIGCASL